MYEKYTYTKTTKTATVPLENRNWEGVWGMGFGIGFGIGVRVRPQGPLKDNTRLRWTAASDVGTRIWRISEIKSVEIISVCWKVCHEQLSQDAISFGQSILASAAIPLHLESDFKRRHVSQYLEYVSTLRLRFVLQYFFFNFKVINLFLLNKNAEIALT